VLLNRPILEYENSLEERDVQSLSYNVPESKSLAEVKLGLANTRKSPGPNDDNAEDFRRRLHKSGNGGGAMQALLPKILPIIDRFWDSDRDAILRNQQWDRQTNGCWELVAKTEDKFRDAIQCPRCVSQGVGESNVPLIDQVCNYIPMI
jgi:hypothetical protein